MGRSPAGFVAALVVLVAAIHDAVANLLHL
jgi:hypothetical protein